MILNRFNWRFPLLGGIAVQISRHLQEGEFPSSHHCEDGVVSRSLGTRNTTPAASIRKLRAVFLMTQPPLLAVVRGGEFALLQSDTSKPHPAVWAASDRPLNNFLQSNLDSCASKEGKRPTRTSLPNLNRYFTIQHTSCKYRH